MATGTVKIYDNSASTGTLIGTITIPASPMPLTLIFNTSFLVGLSILTEVVAQDITVSYR